MTALDRALAWFLEAPTPDDHAAPDTTDHHAQGNAWLRPVAAPDQLAPPHPTHGRRPAEHAALGLPPADQAALGLRPADHGSLGLPPADHATLGLPAAASPRHGVARAGHVSLDDPWSAAGLARGGSAAGFVSLDDVAPAGRVASPRRPIGCAAVLGRPGQAEPVAAALALALGAAAPGRAATVAVIGRADRELAREAGAGGESRPASGGTRAARRLAARLDAHGLSVRPRGRLVWVDVPLEGRRAAAQRAALVGAPAVLAVTAPRAADIEELLAEQDLLLLVTADPGGPLAHVAALAQGPAPVAMTRPLPRGPARSLALAGIAAPRAIRRLVAGATHATEPA